MRSKPNHWATPLAASLSFILIGLAFIPQAGIQNDEALFASGIYEQTGIAQGVKILGHRIPVMLNSYLGAFKSWVYAPIFRFWRPSPFSLRVPVVLLGERLSGCSAPDLPNCRHLPDCRRQGRYRGMRSPGE
jgi:hypothetical protein